MNRPSRSETQDRDRDRVERFSRHLERQGMQPGEARRKAEDISKKCDSGLLTLRDKRPPPQEE